MDQSYFLSIVELDVEPLRMTTLDEFPNEWKISKFSNYKYIEIMSTITMLIRIISSIFFTHFLKSVNANQEMCFRMKITIWWFD